MPVVSPGGRGGVVLPLPPPDTGEESEEEATTSVWSGFGKYAVTSPRQSMLKMKSIQAMYRFGILRHTQSMIAYDIDGVP